MGTFAQLVLSILVVVIIMGGPLTLFALIKIANQFWGGLKVRFVKLSPKEAAGSDASLGVVVEWDNESFPMSVCRIRFDFYELVRGGRSGSFSFTFDDKSAKKRSFIIPMKLKPEDLALLTDSGQGGSAKAISKSYVQVEVENTQGETLRKNIKKSEILRVLREGSSLLGNDFDLLPPTESDTWSLLTRVFPWKKAIAAAETGTDKPAAKSKAAATSSAPVEVNFKVTKVWIEPGCIVCDACENEAPDVFQVLADTCIVRENAPLDNGASIQAAAEGCPVDVIKYTTVPK